MPRVEITIREDDVRRLQEVALWDAAAKVVEYPIVLGLFTIRGVTIGGVSLLVPIVRREHGSGRIRGKWLNYFIASKNIPATDIDASTLRNGHIKAIKLVIVVVINFTGSLDSIQGLEFIALFYLVCLHAILA